MLVELLNKFSKVTGYEINTPKQIVSLHTNNDQSEKEI